MSALIQLKKVCFGNAKPLLFEGLDLVIGEGSSLGIIGPSGVGKSVLLKLIARLLRPSSGEVVYEDALKGGTLSMTFQRSGLFDSLCAWDNLKLALTECTDLKGQELEDVIEQALKEVGLESQGHLFPHEMSGGMQKRLGIARALSLRPKIILYDDPTAGLDPVTSRSIVDLILEMRDKYQMTTLTVSSDLQVAYALSSEILFLFGGTLIERATPTTIRRSENPVVRQFVHGLLQGPLTGELI